MSALVLSLFSALRRLTPVVQSVSLQREDQKPVFVSQLANQDFVDLTPLSNTSGTAKCSIEIINK